MPTWESTTLRALADAALRNPMAHDIDLEGWYGNVPQPSADRLLAALAFIQSVLEPFGWCLVAWSMDRPDEPGQLMVHTLRWRTLQAQRDAWEILSAAQRRGVNDWCYLRPPIDERVGNGGRDAQPDN